MRVSTTDQSLASQCPDLERWEKANGGGAHVFCDASTGRSMDRPEFAKALAGIRAGVYDRLVVWRLDRLGRTAAGLTALFAELQELGCTLVSVREGIDLATPAGRLMANVLASVAAYETEVRRERVAAGIAAAKAKGKKWGGRKAGKQNAHTKAQTATVLELAGAELPLLKISRLCKLSVNTVKKIIRELGA